MNVQRYRIFCSNSYRYYVSISFRDCFFDGFFFRFFCVFYDRDVFFFYFSYYRFYLDRSYLDRFYSGRFDFVFCRYVNILLNFYVKSYYPKFVPDVFKKISFEVLVNRFLCSDSNFLNIFLVCCISFLDFFEIFECSLLILYTERLRSGKNVQNIIEFFPYNILS